MKGGEWESNKNAFSQPSEWSCMSFYMVLDGCLTSVEYAATGLIEVLNFTILLWKPCIYCHVTVTILQVPAGYWFLLSVNDYILYMYSVSFHNLLYTLAWFLTASVITGILLGFWHSSQILPNAIHRGWFPSTGSGILTYIGLLWTG
jgi:hypothetical protein